MYRGNVQALCPTQTWFCSSSLNFNLQSLFFPTLLFPKIILIHCYFYYVGELRCPSTAGCRMTNISLHHPSSFNSLNSFSSSCTAMRVWMYSRGRHSFFICETNVRSTSWWRYDRSPSCKSSSSLTFSTRRWILHSAYIIRSAIPKRYRIKLKYSFFFSIDALEFACAKKLIFVSRRKEQKNYKKKRGRKTINKEQILTHQKK